MSSVVVHVAAPQDVDEEGSSSSVDSLNSDDMYEIYFDKLKKNDPTQLQHLLFNLVQIVLQIVSTGRRKEMY